MIDLTTVVAQKDADAVARAARVQTALGAFRAATGEHLEAMARTVEIADSEGKERARTAHESRVKAVAAMLAELDALAGAN